MKVKLDENLGSLGAPEPFDPVHLSQALRMLIAAVPTQPVDRRLWIVEVDRIREYDDPDRDVGGQP